MKKIFIVIVFTILLNFLQAEPIYNFTVQVDNLNSIPVENAEVHFYSDDYSYDFSGLTDENGEFTFEIDANSYELDDQTTIRQSNENNIKDDDQIRNNVFNQRNNKEERPTTVLLFMQKLFVLSVTDEFSDYSFLEFNAQAVISLDGDQTFEIDVNFNPEFGNDSIDVDIHEEEISSISLEDYLIPITNDNDYTINLIDEPAWVSIDGDEITFNLLNNAEDLTFEAEIIDDDSGENDIIDIDVSVHNYNPEFDINSIALIVEEDILSDYDLTDLIETNTILIDNYVLELDNNPTWASLNNNELEFNLIDNSNDLSFDVKIRDANDPYEITDTLEVSIEVINYDPEFTQNEITIFVTEDTFSNYDLANIINSEIDNYGLTIQDNPTWTTLDNDELQFNLQVNHPNPNETFEVLISDLTGAPNTQTLNVILMITNVNDAPVIGNVPDIEIDETDDHTFTLNLENFVGDEESSLDEMEVQLDYTFNSIDATFVYENNSLEVNFIPEINIDYHIANNLYFTFTITDGTNQVQSSTVTWTYNPFLKTLSGSIYNHYTGESVSGNTIIIPNGYTGVNTIIDGTEFMSFYDEDYAQVNIENPLYYNSNRYIELNNDLERDFTIIPVQINPSLGYDNIEAGCDQAFRTGGNNGQFFGGTTKYVSDQLTVFICTNNAWGYTPNAADIAKINESLTYYDSFTNGLLRPYDNVPVVVSDVLSECAVAAADPGYIFVNWDPNIGGGGNNGRTLNGHTIIDSGVTMLNHIPGQAAYNQEFSQAIGPGLDQDGVGPSTFCQNCAIPNVPTNLDHQWMQRNYDRTPGNMEEDIDYIPIERGNVFTEVVRIEEEFLPSGEKIRTLEYLGYYYAHEMFWSYDDVFEELPKGAKLIKTVNPEHYVVINKPQSDKLAESSQVPPAPQQGQLSDAYPNPFNPLTTINFTVAETRVNTTITIYNSKGQKVKTLVDEVLLPGEHHVIWSPSGVG